MGRYERAAKGSLKEASSLASGIIESIRYDLRREEVRLEEEMRDRVQSCLLYTSPSPRDKRQSRMPSSA